jgi:hypothetical protein
MLVVRLKANNHNCWLTDGEGDPARTLVFSSAKQFISTEEAEKAIVEAKKTSPLKEREYYIEECCYHQGYLCKVTRKWDGGFYDLVTLNITEKNNHEVFLSVPNDEITFYDDNTLILWYMHGFRDELWDKKTLTPDSSLIKKAYRLGKDDAIIGDDVMSSDYISNEEILIKIKK